MVRQRLAKMRMDPHKALKLRLTAEGMIDDILNLVSLPLVKVLLWLLSMAAAFGIGMAFRL
ncbi:MAG: hypothetical protein GTO40_03225 [Deltaproteobacteria bacterium]|nr:hypothetical protein [Deltaproteobacteria bacterium]